MAKKITPQQVKKKYPLLPEIRITGCSEKTRDEVHNIADHIGVTTTAFLKQKLREITDSYPAHMKLPIKKD
jgi:hypothetical protein